MQPRPHQALTCALTLSLGACAPLLPDETPYLTEPRVLAIQAEPAEALPEEAVQFTALVADETGALSEAPLDWAFCTLRKPLAELGPVARACLAPGDDSLLPIGSGSSVTGTLPTETCSLFGPNPPPPREGEPSGRPTDPDVTGGFYQPLLAFLDGDPTLSSVRTRCGLANVTQETYIAWNQAYRSNLNPTLLELLLAQNNTEIPVPPDGEGEPLVVAAGQTVDLAARWPYCEPIDEASDETSTETSTEPCGGAETYVVYDPETEALIPRREALSVTWFATAGLFDEARNGRDSDDPSTRASNTWTAPSTPGEIWLAVVLRDERGGVDYQGYRLRVQ